MAVTIDGNEWPHKVLLIRGPTQIELVDGIPAEYGAAARRYFGEEQGAAWTEQVSTVMPHAARITVRPDWVGILDFQTRFPEALARRMGQPEGIHPVGRKAVAAISREWLVPENGSAQRAGGVAGPAGDMTRFTIAENAIEIVAGIALSSVEHEQCLARRARFFFEDHH